MTYVPPNRRYKKNNNNKNYRKQTGLEYNEKNFPALGSVNNNIKKTNSVWGKGSFKDVVSSDDIVFDFNVLEKTKKETYLEYYNRLSMFFKRTSTLSTYYVFNVTHSKKQKCYKVIARHETIAKFLCQRAEYENHARHKDTHYIKFKSKLVKEMADDGDFSEYIMDLVDGDDNRRDEAIGIYYRQQKIEDEIRPTNWLNPEDVKCVKTKEHVLSKEKIFY